MQLVVSEQYGGSTVEVTRRIQVALDGLRPLLARDGIDLDATLFRPADFIDLETGNVWSALKCMSRGRRDVRRSLTTL